MAGLRLTLCVALLASIAAIASAGSVPALSAACLADRTQGCCPGAWLDGGGSGAELRCVDVVYMYMCPVPGMSNACGATVHGACLSRTRVTQAISNSCNLSSMVAT